MKKKDAIWNAIIAVQILLYLVLTTAIFAVHRKISLLEAQADNSATADIPTPQPLQIEEKISELQIKLAKSKNDDKTRQKLANLYYRRGNLKKTIEENQLQGTPNALGWFYPHHTGIKPRDHLLYH